MKQKLKELRRKWDARVSRNLEKAYRKETPEHAEIRRDLGTGCVGIIVGVFFLIGCGIDLHRLVVDYPIVRDAIVENYTVSTHKEARGGVAHNYIISATIEDGDNSYYVLTTKTHYWDKKYEKGETIEVRCPKTLADGDLVPTNYVALDVGLLIGGGIGVIFGVSLLSSAIKKRRKHRK